MVFSIGFFLFGLAFIIVGGLFILKNKGISSRYQKGLVKHTNVKTLDSKGAGIYIRIRYYLAGGFFAIVGLFLILASFA